MFDTHVLLQLADEQMQARLDEAAHQRLVDEAVRGQRARGVRIDGRWPAVVGVSRDRAPAGTPRGDRGLASRRRSDPSQYLQCPCRA